MPGGKEGICCGTARLPGGRGALLLAAAFPLLAAPPFAAAGAGAGAVAVALLVPPIEGCACEVAGGAAAAALPPLVVAAELVACIGACIGGYWYP